jgi:hypothetical protein
LWWLNEQACKNTDNIKTTVEDKFACLKGDVYENKYEALKNQERLSQQLYGTKSELAHQLGMSTNCVENKIADAKYCIDNKVASAQQYIVSNVDGNFKYTNEKLCEAKYDSLKNHTVELMELGKVANELSKSMDYGFKAVAQQVCEAKYEALKNDERLYSQAAANQAATQLEAFKNKAELQAQLADLKFETLRQKDSLSRQMDECCCELKMLSAKETCDLQQKIDASTSAQIQLQKEIQTDRYREDLSALKTENAIFKYADAEDPYYGGYGGYGRWGRRGRLGDKTESEAVVYNYIDPYRGRSHRRSHHSGSPDSRDSRSSRHSSPSRTPRSHRSH